MRTACITLDVDFTDYRCSKHLDELDLTFNAIADILKQYPTIHTTWFVRLDYQIEEIFGAAEYIFTRHAKKLDWLRENGHEIAWHHHAYQLNNSRWEPETDADRFAASIYKYGNLARKQGLISARMGWGQQTNTGVEILEDLGFTVDSSAIPRPNYTWNNIPLRDWSMTEQNPYNPSKSNYQLASKNTRNLIEIPISTIPLPLPSDTTEGVIRYINPAYHSELFSQAIEQCQNELIVLISHPYEFIPREATYSALAFDTSVLQTNLNHLVELGFSFKTISSVTEHYKKDCHEQK